MKSLWRVTIILLIIMALFLFLAGNVLAETKGSVQTTNLDLTYLINGMDLNQTQFSKTLKLTKDFLNQIERSSKTLTKLTTSRNSKLQITTDGFEKITAEQYRFLIKMKEYHQNLTKTVGGEKGERIFKLIYDAIPFYLLPEKATNQVPSNPDNAMANGIGQMNPMNNMNIPGPMGMNEKNGTNNMDSMNSMNDKNGMNNMNSMSGMNAMNNTPGMNAMNNMPGMTNGTGTVSEQLINQLQTSNAILTQMFTLLQKKNGVPQAQIQSILQLLINQEALIRLLSTNTSAANTTGGSGSMNMGPSNMSGNSGGMSGMGMM